MEPQQLCGPFKWSEHKVVAELWFPAQSRSPGAVTFRLRQRQIADKKGA